MSNSSSSSAEIPICVLEIRGLGPAPSFKNSKMIVTIKKKGGEPRNLLITEPKKRKWMDKATDSFESQLLSLCQTTEGGTSTDALRRFLTACLPRDDAWQFVPELKVNIRRVKKGNEGATVKLFHFDQPEFMEAVK